MNKDSKTNYKWIENLNVTIMSLAYISLFVIAFFIQNDDKIMILYYFGWAIWILALVLTFSPNFIFKKYGGVTKGKSYVNTTKLVDKGIYSIIRHPQYGGGLYISFSLILIQQTWVSLIIGIVCILTAYLSMVFEEDRLIVKFGEDYKDYMKRVPRVTLILGIYRKLKEKKSK